MTRLMWFRTDLRVHDNPALLHSRRDNDDTTVAVTFACEPQWRKHDLGDRRINLMYDATNRLHQRLQDLGIPLLVIPVDSFSDSVQALKDLTNEFDISELNFNIEYEVNERHRDINVVKWCRDNNIEVNKFHDQCVIPPGQLKTQNDDPYRVYSPFRKAWLKAMGDQIKPPCPAPERQDMRTLQHDIKDAWEARQWLPESHDDEHWSADEDAAHDSLHEFLDSNVLHYHEWRDIPDMDATSRMSFYLAVGLITARQCIYMAWQRNACMLSGGEQGIDSWINELVWREFYRHLLVAYPGLCKHQTFRSDYANIPWRSSEQDFERWCKGETGYPIVDAAMRQLLEQGWMHNRLRMIVAMFLTKHLLIDWRWGEKHFSQHLVDADLASNNGGWQWSASTGADGAPYFRIFNPITQSEKFDAKGNFIAMYIPELGGLKAKDRHFPSPEQRSRCQYPSPIVEHKTARERALNTFKNLTS